MAGESDLGHIPVCVFAKAIQPGSVKTRLIPELGGERAAQLAAALFKEMLARVRGLPWAVPIVVTTDGGRGLEIPEGIEVWTQEGADLGERMERALKRALERSQAAVLVGTDLPGLPPRLFEQARTALNSFDAVLGPAEDGGFYLIGLRRCPAGLLSNLPWSRSDAMALTVDRMRANGLTVSTIERWFDVDEPVGLGRLRRELAAGKLVAPGVSRVLRIRTHLQPISVIIATLNEEARIAARLDELSRIEGICEVIVVDGGSSDRTVEVARARGRARVISTGTGRAIQMNAGARAASGEILLFLHADTVLPTDADRHVISALSDGSVVAGAFRIWTVNDGAPSWVTPFLHVADIRSRYTKLPYGDQAIFVRADVFRKIGGFPEQPLMEDLELSKMLRKAGRTVTVPASVLVSGRRFIARPLYYLLLMNLFPLLYRAGVSAETLSRWWGEPR